MALDWARKYFGQYAITGLPKSGCTWFASLLCEHNMGRLFMSHEHHTHIKSATGYEEEYQLRWLTRPKNFLRDEWNPFKLPFYARHFGCIAFFCERQFYFPGATQKTTSSMGQIWDSLVEAHDQLPQDIQNMIWHTLRFAKGERYEWLAAYTIGYYQLLKDAERLDIPIVSYYDLSTTTDVYGYLRNNLPNKLYSDELAADISCCRSTPESRYRLWEYAKLDAFYWDLLGYGQDVPLLLKRS